MPDDAPPLLPIFSGTLWPAPDQDVEAALAAAIRAGSAGSLSRMGDTFIAGLSARVLVDRLAAAGFVVCRVRA